MRQMQPSFLDGIGTGEGVGIGKALCFTPIEAHYTPRTVSDIPAEKNRLHAAVAAFADQTEAQAAIMDQTSADGEILRGHIALVHDPFFTDLLNLEMDGGAMAEAAVETVCTRLSELFAAAPDELTRARAADITDIRNGLLSFLTGAAAPNLSELPEHTVLVTDELTPSMTADFDRAHIEGVITQKGGLTAHSAIICKALGIPAVLGVQNALEHIKQGQEVIVDSTCGRVYTDFSVEFQEKYRAKQALLARQQEKNAAFRGRPSQTADGKKVQLFANIGTPAELDAVRVGDAEGVGLFRTEFLFLDQPSLPDEQTQFEAYRAVAAGMHGKSVIIRTLDIGGDKDIPYLDLPKEENPFLGFRAIRYCLENQALYRTQLRALLRASAYGNVHILLPMITQTEEICAVRDLLAEIKAELRGKNIPFNEDIPLGAMIETPAAVLISDLLARQVDFFSIGTNDLTGYLLAADRGNEKVRSLYSIFHPAVLRAIETVGKNAHAAGISCGMCGEAAADQRLLPLWLSFDLDKLSVTPGAVLSLRRKLSVLSTQDCQHLAQETLRFSSAQQIEQFLTRAMEAESDL